MKRRERRGRRREGECVAGEMGWGEREGEKRQKAYVNIL